MNDMRSFLAPLFLIALLVVFGSFAEPFSASAQQTVEEIEAEMARVNAEKARLEEEIRKDEQRLQEISGERQTLQSAVRTLDASRSRLQSQINLTEKEIDIANLTLAELGYEIRSKESEIELNRDTLARSIRTMDAADDVSLVEQLFSADSLAEAWRQADSIAALNEALRTNVEMLNETKRELEERQLEVADTQEELSSLSTQLGNEKQGLDVTRQAQNELLTQTKNQESEYQRILAAKRAQRQQFESALSALEDSLQIAIDPNRIPSAGSGVLSWPFTNSFMESCKGKAGALGNPYCITQYFGNTPFASANPQVYNGGGHNAVDFGAPTGTSVVAALSGTVLDTGNTDAVAGCYSFGKWVVVRHANGLATLYSHLSSIQVSAGQAVSTGQLIGYSGMTGYATGPHLHFGVYASQGIQIMTLAQYRGATTPCANAKMPVAPKEAYLNPMSYL